MRNGVTRITATAAPALLALAALGLLGAAPGVGPTPLLAQGPGQGTGRITGIVTGDNGQPLVGVQVSIPATRNGAVSADGGRFAINGVAPGTYTVRAQRIGFAPTTRQVTVANGAVATVSFQLAPVASNLEQVVVVGYGTQRRADVTGAVSSVSGADLVVRAAPTPAVSSALEGRAPGVQVTTNSGTPGAGASVRIRGINSISANTEPLYVIDGIPAEQGTTSTDPTFNPLNSINPNDIESIDILKDASATSIYGARGANGVVLVTTRRGARNSSRTSFETSVGTQSIAKRINPLTGPQYRTLVNEAFVNAGRSPDSLPYTAAQIAGAPTYNYVDMMTHSAPQQSHTLAFSGGDEHTRILMSGNYTDQQGILLNSRFGRAGGQFNLDRDMSSRFRVGTSLNLTSTSQGLNRTDNGSIGNGANGILAAINFDPTLAPRNALGQWNQRAQLGEQLDNPLANASEIVNPRRVSRVLGNLYGDYDILPTLRLHSTLGGNLSFERTPFYAPGTIAPGSPNGDASLYSNEARDYTNENTLNYRRANTGPGTLELLGGFSVQTHSFVDQYSESRGFPSDQLQYNNLGAGATLVGVGTSETDWTILSYFSRAIYNIKDRYIFQASGRRDGSSRFGANNKWAFFPSGSFAWRLSDEPFLKNRGPFSDLKLRLSYGSTGNQAVTEYQSLARLSSGNFSLGTPGGANGGTTTIVLSPSGAAANPNLKWEQQQQANVGLDASILSGRVSFTADAYQATTKDLLLFVSLPALSGYSSQLQNVGSLRNRGFELGVNTVNVDTKQFSWRSTLNLTLNRNRVLSLGGPTSINPGTDRFGFYIGNQNPTIVQVGQPIGTFYGYKVNGLYQQGDACHLTDTKQCAPGEYKVQDTNGDGVINSNDRVILGNAQPKYYGGFNNTFTAGAFSLNAFTNFSVGNKIANVGGAFTELATGFLNESQVVLDRWTPTHTNTLVPRANNQRPRLLYSTLIENGSFLRMQTVTLGYELPRTLIPRVQSARIYLTGQNLFVLTNYSGFDPEVNSIGGDTRFTGIDVGAYPRARTYNVGLNLTF